jgi:hypothetical protein
MPIFTDSIRQSDDRPFQGIEAPLGDVLGATAQDAWTYSPLSSAFRWADLDTAQSGGRVPSPVLPVDEARQRIKDEGLEGRLTVPEDGIRTRALDILVNRKKDEITRQSTLSRASGDLGAGALRVGTALATSMLDPLNVASAFIPVVGEARYARLLEQAATPLARFGVRAGVGAVEGAAGAALVEPIVYGAAHAEQADYGLSDSLASIAFGGVMGAGLHSVGGAVADAFKRPRSLDAVMDRAPFETRRAALQGAVASAIDGAPNRTVDLLDTIAQGEPRTAAALADAPGSRTLTDEHPLVQSYLEDVKALSRGNFEPAKGASLFGFIRDQGGIKRDGEIAAVLQDARLAPGVVNNAAGLPADEVALRAWEAGFIGQPGSERPGLQELYDALASEASGQRVYPADLVPQIHERQSYARGLEKMIADANIHANTPHLDVARALAAHHLAQDRVPATATLDSLARDTREAFQPEAIERSRELDKITAPGKIDPAAVHADTLARLDSMHIPDDERAVIRTEIETAQLRAKDWGVAAREAAECVARFVL